MGLYRSRIQQEKLKARSLQESIKERQTFQPSPTDDSFTGYRENINDNVSTFNDPRTNEKKYFVDSDVKPIEGKTKKEMSLFERFMTESKEAELMGKSMAGNLGIGGLSSLTGIVGGFLKQMESMPTPAAMTNSLGIFKLTGELSKKVTDKTVSQHLLDLSNEINEYKNREFPTSYQDIDLTLKNFPKLLTHPDFVLNTMVNMIQTGIAALAGGYPALYSLEAGDKLTEQRAKALLRGDKEMTQKELLYSMSMAAVVAWMENLGYKVMVGGKKIPLSESLINKISNRTLKTLTNWGFKTAFESAEEFAQEALPVIVSEVVFKEKDDVRNWFQQAIDSLPKAIKQGEAAAVMALPGAGLLSGVGVATENRISQQQGDLQTAYNNTLQDIQNKFLSEVSEAQGSLGENAVYENGNLKQSIVDSRAFDISKKAQEFLGFDEQTAKNVENTLKKGEYKNSDELINKAFETIEENADENTKPYLTKARESLQETELTEKGTEKEQVKVKEELDTGKEKVSEAEEIKEGEKVTEKTGVVRIPKQDVIHLKEMADGENIGEEFVDMFSKPLTQKQVDKFTENQTAVLQSGLESAVANDGLESGVIVDNLESLKTGQITTPTPVRQTTVQEPVELTTQINENNFQEAVDRLTNLDNEMQQNAAQREGNTKVKRDNLRASIQETLTKDARSFVDVKTEKDKASAFTLNYKKIPTKQGKKYGYSATLYTPLYSKAVNYAPKFKTAGKVKRTAIQGGIRMLQEARQAGVPEAGLSKIRKALMKANNALGAERLPEKRITRAVKETKQRVGKVTPKKPKTLPKEVKVKKLSEINTVAEAKEARKALAKPYGGIKQWYKIPENVQEKINAINKKILALNEKKPVKGGKGAAIGEFSDIKSYQKHISQFNHIELPELIDIIKELSGKTPIVRKLRESLRGRFQPDSMDIFINPTVFANGEVQAGQVLAHELGHLIDYLPDRTQSRGNILGRIGTLRNFLRQTFTNIETEQKVDKLLEEKRQLQIRRRSVETGTQENKGLLAKIIKLNRKIDSLRSKGITEKEIRKELWNLSKKWRPLPESYTPNHLRYRKSSEELYADALSVLFNDPALLMQEAPVFYKSFFKNLDEKPEVKRTLFDTWELINKGEEALFSKRQDNIYNMFNKGEEVIKIKRAEREEGKYSFMSKLKTELMDRNQVMIDKVNKLIKEGKAIPDDANPIYMLEEYNYMAGIVKDFVETKIQPIMNNLEENDISWEQFGAYLLLERAANERGEMANPGGFTKETAENQLQNMEKYELGKEKFNIVESQAEKFRLAMEEVLDNAFESGLYKPDLYEQMKANESYATFQVIDYINDYIPASIKQQVGTFADVANPATQTAMKIISIIRATETNNVKKGMIDFLKTHYSEEVKEANTRFTGKFREPIESREPNEKLFTYMEDGQVQGVYVDPYISKIFDRVSASSKNFILKNLRAVNTKATRPLLIQYNPGFMAFNVIRDFWRFWKNIPGMTLTKAVKQYAKAVNPAIDRVLGIKDPLISEMYKSKILSVTYNELISGQDNIDKQIDVIMEKAGVTNTTPKKTNKFMEPFIKALNFLDDVGQVIETMPKVAGYTYLKDSNLFTPAEMRRFVRTSVGSPDFLRQNAGYGWTNEIFLFSNAIKEAIRADTNIMVNPKTRSGYWAKTTMSTFAPKLLMLAAAAGLMGDPLKKMFDNMSEYDKTNYICVPLGIDKNGKTIYVRIPMDETGRFLGGLLWKGMTVAKNDQAFAKDVLQLLSYTGGQLPSLSPVLDTVRGIGQYAIGQNPYDFFRGRNVIPDREFKAGGWDSFKPFTLWALQNMGGSVLLNFNILEKTPGMETWGEKLLQMPLISNFVGRFFRVSNYGQIEDARKIQDQVNRENSKRLIDWEDKIYDAVAEYNKGEKSESRRERMASELARDILGDEGDSQKERYIKDKFNKSILRTEVDSKIQAVMALNTNEAKIRVLRKQEQTMSKEEFEKHLTDLLSYKIISENVYYEIKK